MLKSFSAPGETNKPYSTASPRLPSRAPWLCQIKSHPLTSSLPILKQSLCPPGRARGGTGLAGGCGELQGAAAAGPVEPRPTGHCPSSACSHLPPARLQGSEPTGASARGSCLRGSECALLGARRFLAPCPGERTPLPQPPLRATACLPNTRTALLARAGLGQAPLNRCPSHPGAPKRLT